MDICSLTLRHFSWKKPKLRRSLSFKQPSRKRNVEQRVMVPSQSRNRCNLRLLRRRPVLHLKVHHQTRHETYLRPFKAKDPEQATIRLPSFRHQRRLQTRHHHPKILGSVPVAKGAFTCFSNAGSFCNCLSNNALISSAKNIGASTADCRVMGQDRVVKIAHVRSKIALSFRSTRSCCITVSTGITKTQISFLWPTTPLMPPLSNNRISPVKHVCRPNDHPSSLDFAPFVSEENPGRLSRHIASWILAPLSLKCARTSPIDSRWTRITLEPLW